MFSNKLKLEHFFRDTFINNKKYTKKSFSKIRYNWEIKEIPPSFPLNLLLPIVPTQSMLILVQMRQNAKEDHAQTMLTHINTIVVHINRKLYEIFYCNWQTFPFIHLFYTFVHVTYVWMLACIKNIAKTWNSKIHEIYFCCIVYLL